MALSAAIDLEGNPMSERFPLAALFDAALDNTRRLYGDAARPVSITVRTSERLDVTFDVPLAWEADPRDDNAASRISQPGTVADTLATLVEIGHRQTRQALLDSMEKAGRRRPESVVSESLAQLMKIGLINNRKDVSPHGYGIVGSD
jgi:hypothetical protein